MTRTDTGEEGTIEGRTETSRIMEDMRDKVQAEYHVLELQPEGPLSESVFEAYNSKRKRRQGTAEVEAKSSQKLCLYLIDSSKDLATMILLSKTAAGVAFCVENGIVMLKMVPETPLQFGVAERLSRTFRAESTEICVEAPKMLWADSVPSKLSLTSQPTSHSCSWFDLKITSILQSLTHLKVFGCDSFVKVKDVWGEAMKCTFIGSGSDEMRYSFQDMKSHQVIRSRDITFVDSIYGARSATDSSSLTKPIQKSQVVLVDIPENLAENDSIVAEHGLSSKITQSPGGSSDTSERFENSCSFEDSGRSNEENSEDGASSKEGGSKTP
ncbi:hypothetical protein Tco_1454442 [Tanacetum coccineum]